MHHAKNICYCYTKTAVKMYLNLSAAIISIQTIEKALRCAERLS